ncbi:hypothetical protein P153DRAFT_301778 [Dothidotthia symphoricarpi CBS 119687]|uniref:F-box domain-containing protein n=1 Tax=Dothidotthia symphoricarpi CBS 119687 TaxID=1392245 RepID=A0A6A6A2L1_9PLEO|nr:uncharacterized protein P153DRAFT_301778 [Dothidotthia symphoricarpi CBS 119687]KAF2124811.1 hypothetical protein P153DRAFT_301778 [Dothidotthia symphoricarpi CBS 119687]
MHDAPHSPSRPARPRNPSHSLSLSNSAPSPTTRPSTAPAPDPTFSLLLSLPSELRDRVYSFALTSAFPFWWPNTSPLKHNVGVSLLRVNRQVHDEAAKVLYQGNKFLFTHPSDCNIFRVVAGPQAEKIAEVYFRVREKDLRLWTGYLGSRRGERSLRGDLPGLKRMWVFMRCGGVGMGMAHLGGGAMAQGHVLAQVVGGFVGQHAALGNAQAQAQAQAPPPPPPPPPQLQAGAQPQPPPPPPPPPFIHFAHPQHPAPVPAPAPNPQPLFSTFLRFERELGIEALCLSLQETRNAATDVKIVCIMRVPRREVERLLRMYPDELVVDRAGDARTRFRRVHGVDVSLEVSGFDAGAGPG